MSDLQNLFGGDPSLSSNRGNGKRLLGDYPLFFNVTPSQVQVERGPGDLQTPGREQ